jgi:cytochrome c553
MSRRSVRHIALGALGTLIALAIGGFLLVWSGLYNVAASRGHWAIVEWILAFGMRNSVELRASMIDAPDLDDAGMILLGANHYKSGCAPCHGAPGVNADPVAQAMLPPPPDLTDVAERWRDGELFWIVKHGIKYTGMPAWVAQSRDDEVWALVAFLKALRSMRADRYADLLRAPEERSSDVMREAGALCGGCHGGPGSGPRSALVPGLHGQRTDYLVASLGAYANGNRFSGIMQAVAGNLSHAQIRSLSDFYSALPQPPAPGSAAPDADVAAGRRLAATGAPAAGIPACDSCHGDNALSIYPLLSGQSAAYLAGQLRLWKKGLRNATGPSAIMAPIAERMTDKEIDDVSAFYAAQPPMQASR